MSYLNPDEHLSAVEEHLPFFVYGTLREGQPNFMLYLKGRTLEIQPAYLDGAYLFSMGHYPMALEHLPQGYQTSVYPRLSGDVISIPAPLYAGVLSQLDLLEEYDPRLPERCMYWRVARTVTLAGSGQQVKAWFYLGNPAYLEAEHPLIEYGDWCRFRQQTRLAETRYCLIGAR